MSGERTVVKALTPVMGRHAGTVGALVALGSAVALSEGIGIGLFLPLLRSVGDPSAGLVGSGRLGALLEVPFAHLASTDRIRAILVALFGLLVIRHLTVLAHGVLLARLTSRVAHELRSAAVAALLRVEERWLRSRDTGAWLNLLESPTWETAAAVGTLVGIATRLCKVGVFALALVWISWRLTLLVVVVLGLVSIGVRRVAPRVDALGHAEKRAWEVMAQRMVELLRTARTIRVFGREADEQARFDACSEHERRTFERLQVLQATVPPASEFLVATLMLVVLCVAIDGPGQLPAVLTFLAMLYRLHPQVQQLDAARVSFAAALAPAASVLALLDPRDQPVLGSGARPFTGLESGVTFHDVSYRHDAGGPLALDGVSLHIPARATTAIVGPSGAGKSTLVRLLARLADPTTGTIEVDGTPLPELDLATWRARIAIVGQDVPLLDASVAENIAYGRPTPASDEDIRTAARRADADAFIQALPEGYATRLGADGVRVSGGERQRIALARALLRDPEILVLDEATNAVDGISADLIRRTLVELGVDRTVVIVSHRPATVESADQIVLLDGGRVRELGRVRQLLRRGGLFARLHALDRAGAPAGASRRGVSR